MSLTITPRASSTQAAAAAASVAPVNAMHASYRTRAGTPEALHQEQLQQQQQLVGSGNSQEDAIAVDSSQDDSDGGGGSDTTDDLGELPERLSPRPLGDDRRQPSWQQRQQEGGGGRLLAQRPGSGELFPSHNPFARRAAGGATQVAGLRRPMTRGMTQQDTVAAESL